MSKSRFFKALLLNGIGGSILLLTGCTGGQTTPPAQPNAPAEAPRSNEKADGAATAPATGQSAAIRAESVWARPASAGANSAQGQSGMKMNSQGHGSTNTQGQNAMTGPTSAIYMVLVNSGTQPDALVRVRTELAEVAELHKTTIENEVMRMQPVDRIEVPAGGRVELKRGGLHIMLMGLKRNVAAGDRFRAVLVFERGGEIPVEVEVREQ